MFNFFRKKEKPLPSFIELLENVDYFEFVEKDKVNGLKSKIAESFEKYRVFSTSYDNNNIPECKKMFFCDSETLYEANGYKTQLDKMKAGFNKVCNYHDLVNQIPESFIDGSNSSGNWDDAVIGYITLVNEYLSKSGSQYKCYPAYSGNEGSIYILTEAQFLLMDDEIKDNHTRPMLLEEWSMKYNPKVIAKSENVNNQLDQLSVGSVVNHKKFGRGKILDLNDKGVANIEFDGVERLIIVKFANMTIVK